MVSAEGKDCTVVVNFVVGSERRSPSHASGVAVVSSSVEGTGSWRLGRQVVAEVLGSDPGTGANSAPESCKSLVRIARVPRVVGQAGDCRGSKSWEMNWTSGHCGNPRLTEKLNPPLHAEDLESTGSLADLGMKLRSPRWKANTAERTPRRIQLPSYRARYPHLSHTLRD